MDRDIARLNIEHFRRLLERETDEERRVMLLRLLAEEEAKLSALLRGPRERKRSG
jgi:predicted aminopeptidase